MPKEMEQDVQLSFVSSYLHSFEVPVKDTHPGFESVGSVVSIKDGRFLDFNVRWGEGSRDGCEESGWDRNGSGLNRGVARRNRWRKADIIGSERGLGSLSTVAVLAVRADLVNV